MATYTVESCEPERVVRVTVRGLPATLDTSQLTVELESTRMLEVFFSGATDVSITQAPQLLRVPLPCSVHADGYTVKWSRKRAELKLALPFAQHPADVIDAAVPGVIRAEPYNVQPSRSPPKSQTGAAESALRSHAEVAWIKAGGSVLLDEDGVSETVELQHWRQVFVDKALESVRLNVLATLEGGSSLLDKHGGRQYARKKDSPDEEDKVGREAVAHAQQVQAQLVECNIRRHKQGAKRRAVCAPATQQLGEPVVWEAPHSPSVANRLYEHLYPWVPRTRTRKEKKDSFVATSLHYACEYITSNNINNHPEPPYQCASCPRVLPKYLGSTSRFTQRRVATDNVAIAMECRTVIGATIVAMEGLPDRAGETTLEASEPGVLDAWMGAQVSGLVKQLCARVHGLVVSHFVEERPLYIAGALLTRLQPPPAYSDSSVDYDYTTAHVDKANVASYDYSAVLYLNTKGHGFTGGDFCFNDVGLDEIVEPRQGRCVLFTSGVEHLHQARAVESGSRFVLALWFTLSQPHGTVVERLGGIETIEPSKNNNSQECMDQVEKADLAAEAPSMESLQQAVDAKISELQAELGLDEATLAAVMKQMQQMRAVR